MDLSSIIGFIIDIIGLFKFWSIVDHWEEGILLRLGKWRNKKILQPGLHWTYPFYIDRIVTINIKPAVAELSPQTITTSDDKVLGVQGVVKFEIVDSAKALLEVDNEREAIIELTQATIRDIISQKTYLQCTTDNISTEITGKAKSEATKWGIKITKVTLKSLGRMTSIRLMQDTKT